MCASYPPSFQVHVIFQSVSLFPLDVPSYLGRHHQTVHVNKPSYLHWGISFSTLPFHHSSFLFTQSLRISSSSAMLHFKQSPDKPRPPPVGNNTTSEPPSLTAMHDSPNPLGPVVVFIARASNLKDHNYPNAEMNSNQMHEYLRSLLVITLAEHRKQFGFLGVRPHKMQTIIQPAHSRIRSNSRASKYLGMALEEARTCKTECIFVIYGWDGWTTDKMNIIELCEKFHDVPFYFHVYANRGTPREFYEVNAHKVNACLRQRVNADDPTVVGDGSTALYIRILETLPPLELGNSHPDLSVVEKDALSKYDKRFAGVYENQADAPKPGVTSVSSNSNAGVGALLMNLFLWLHIKIYEAWH